MTDTIIAESRKAYAARHVRVAIEQAKIAVMEAQQLLQESDPDIGTDALDLLAAAFTRLDGAWGRMAATEANERKKRLRIMESGHRIKNEMAA